MPNQIHVLYFHALTAVHPGIGSAIGTVDLPIQRERHTNWPTIAASSIKGVLRDNLRQNNHVTNEELNLLFGPPPEESDKNRETFAGAITITDARILAFPVRSLQGVFAWVTSPAVLLRYKRDLKLASRETPGIKPVEDGKALVARESNLIIHNKQIVLEEFDFDIEMENSYASYIAENAISDEMTKKIMEKNLVVIHDGQFNYFVQYATEIQARIALDYETKTVKEHALFYQEFLPTDTLMYSLVMVTDARKNSEKTASDLFSTLKNKLSPVIQIGGDETIGKGFCVLTWHKGESL